MNQAILEVISSLALGFFTSMLFHGDPRDLYLGAIFWLLVFRLPMLSRRSK